MPFTPCHFGPSGFLGLVFRKWIDIPVFILANVIIDVEVLILAGIGAGWLRHGFCHTLAGAAVVGLLWGMAAYPLRHRFIWAMRKLHIPYEPAFWKMAVSGILGAWLHVLIDGLYHYDAKIFWPNETCSIRRLIYRFSTYIGTDRVYRHEIVQGQVTIIAIGFLLATIFAYALIRKTSGKNVTLGFLKSCVDSGRFWLLCAAILAALYGLSYIFPKGKTTEACDTAANESPRLELLTLTTFEAIADKDLLGCWRFDAGSGVTAQDSSGNGNTGTITGARWAPTITGCALDFDGMDDFVKIGSAPSLDNLEAITLAAWIYPRADTHWHVLDKGDGDKRIFALGTKKRLIGMVRYKGTRAYSESANNTFLLDRWQHVVMTWSQTTNKTRIFLDGLEVRYSLQEVGSGAMLDDSKYPFFIGARGAMRGTTYFDGLIDDVFIYGRALNPGEIMVLYNWLTTDGHVQSDKGLLSKRTPLPF